MERITNKEDRPAQSDEIKVALFSVELLRRKNLKGHSACTTNLSRKATRVTSRVWVLATVRHSAETRVRGSSFARLQEGSFGEVRNVIGDLEFAKSTAATWVHNALLNLGAIEGLPLCERDFRVRTLHAPAASPAVAGRSE